MKKAVQFLKYASIHNKITELLKNEIKIERALIRQQREARRDSDESSLKPSGRRGTPLGLEATEAPHFEQAPDIKL